jgi:DNA-binding LytR/AlgR family response regulator
MNVLIIEDERKAANRLVEMLKDLEKEIMILGVLDSIESAVSYLTDNLPPDLIFLDIELGDGQSFEIFNKVHVNSYIIFVTAFNEYAIKAFKYNSIDYILKPLKKDDLVFALNKYKSASSQSKAQSNLVRMAHILRTKANDYKRRFLIRKGSRLVSIDAGDVAIIFRRGRSRFIKTFSGIEHNIDNHLDELEAQLNPDQFFRVTRKALVNIGSVEKVIASAEGRLKLLVTSPIEEELVISRLRVADFKKWLGK